MEFVIDNGHLKKCIGTEREIEIPKGVETIDSGAFEESKQIVSVVLPETVSIIAKSAFSSCDLLTSIRIPNSVIYIGDWAFSGCKSLREVFIPDSVIYLGNTVFLDCYSLRYIHFSKSLSRIEDGTLAGCEKLQKLDIPKSVREVSDSAFIRCRSVKYIQLPDSIAVLGRQAFGLCDSLETVVVPPSVYMLDDMVFYKCPSLSDISIPSSVLLTGYETFPKPADFSTAPFDYIKIYDSPNRYEQLSLIEIAKCSDLGFAVNANGVLEGYSGNSASVTLPEAVRIIDQEAFYQNTFIESVRIPEGVLRVCRGSFSNCKNLKEVVFEGQHTTIEEGAFRDCDSLELISLPESLRYLPNSVFWYCKSLQEIALPESIQVIGDYAFLGCSKLSSVQLPASLTKIGLEAFCDCESLTEVTFPQSLCSIDYRAFERCPRLSSVSLPSRAFFPAGAFDEGVRFDFFDTEWVPSYAVSLSEVPETSNYFEADEADTTVTTDMSSSYANLLRSLVYSIEVFGSFLSIIDSYNYSNLREAISDAQYIFDADARSLYSMIISDDTCMLLSPEGEAITNEYYSYNDYRRLFSVRAQISNQFSIAQIVDILTKLMSDVFQESIIALQDSVRNDHPVRSLLLGSPDVEDGIIFDTGYVYNHLGSIIGSTASSDAVVFIPDDSRNGMGMQSIMDIEITEMTKCMIPGDFNTLFKFSKADVPVYTSISLGGQISGMTVPPGSSELDSYFKKELLEFIREACS